MEIASSITHRLLAYIEAVTEQGHELSGEDFDAYAAAPDREVTQAAGSIGLANVGSLLLKKIMGEVQSEPFADYFTRLRWITGDGHISLTPLGRAVLRALDAREVREDIPVSITLSAGDPLSYAQAIGKLAEAGEALLVDPYFGFEHFHDVATLTKVDRILLSEKASARTLAALSVALGTLPPERVLRVRIGRAEQMHDRFIIPKAGAVTFLGTSLSGVGKTLTVMGPLNEPAATRIRDSFERAWAEGKPIDPPKPSVASSESA